MALDVASPRISFSHDLKEFDFVPIETHNHLRLNPTIDFDFCIATNLQLSSADELFANGKILPVEIKKAPPPKQTAPDKKRLIEFLSTSAAADQGEEKPVSKPFWQFRRSSSVNFDRGSLLQFLSRSNSTGSVPNPKPGKVMQKQNSLKEAPVNRRSSSASGLNQYYHYNKPCLGKSRSKSNGNGVRVTPVLNIPPSYITRGPISLFGIASFFSSKKSKKRK